LPDGSRESSAEDALARADVPGGGKTHGHGGAKGSRMSIRRFAGRIGGLVSRRDFSHGVAPGHEKAERGRVQCTPTKRLGIDFA